VHLLNVDNVWDGIIKIGIVESSKEIITEMEVE